MKKHHTPVGVMLLALVALTAGLLAATTAPSQAVSGDKWKGCTRGASCEMQIWTNKCTRSSAFFLTPYDELDPRYTQWVGVQPGCTVRTRHRMVNKAGNDYYYTPWVVSKPKSSYYATTHSVFVGKKRCFSEWAVQRKDKSWYSRIHYSAKFKDSKKFRDICTDN